ncbi:MAG: hypothetical protein ACI8TL_001585 [Natronomonas sp.]|jgi:hypothetical protein
MHVPFHAEMQVTDAIARELLALDVEPRARGPEFLNDGREIDAEILTGGAE